jgi:hypothetical protein
MTPRKSAQILKEYNGKAVAVITGELMSTPTGVQWERLTIQFEDGTQLGINSFAATHMESGLNTYTFLDSKSQTTAYTSNQVSKTVAERIEDK